MPITRKASNSSRIARAPRSEAIAAAAAPPMSRPAVIGAPCLTTPTPLAAPTSELAPTWFTRPEVWTVTIAPNGMAMSSAGVAVTLSNVQASTTNHERQAQRNRVDHRVAHHGYEHGHPAAGRCRTEHGDHQKCVTTP